MAAPPTEAEFTSSAAAIDDLPNDILIEVLLCLPTPVDIIRAAAVSKKWRCLITTPDSTRRRGAPAAPATARRGWRERRRPLDVGGESRRHRPPRLFTAPDSARSCDDTKSFLDRYRMRHKSSPFLGLYVPQRWLRHPCFQIPHWIAFPASNDRDRVLMNAANKASNYGNIDRYQDHCPPGAVGNAFIQGCLRYHPDWRLLDCHNSRLLFTRGDEALEVRSPLAHESILLPFPPDVGHPDSLQARLLQGHDKAVLASFRVVIVQHRREGRKHYVRAVEYDSSRKSWEDHPWKTVNSNIEEVMCAGHRIFCKYTDNTSAALLLDTNNMQFYDHYLPSDINFAIGEIEDNVCCFVDTLGSEKKRLRVWQLDNKMDWEHKKDISLDDHVGYYRPCAISNGIALLCSINLNPHLVFDLNTYNLMGKFEFQGHLAFIMQMPWPPAFSHHTGGFDQDGEPESVVDAKTVAGALDEIEGLSGGALALVEEPAHVDPCQTSPEPSPSPPLVCCNDPSDEVKTVRLLCSSSIAFSVPDTSCRSQDTATAIAPPTDLLTTSSPAECMENRQEMALTMADSPSCPQQGGKLDSSRERKGSPEAMVRGRRQWKPSAKYLEGDLFSTKQGRLKRQNYMNSGGFHRDGDPASVGDARTLAGESDEIEGLLGGDPALAQEPMHMDPCQTQPEPSPSPSLCCFSTDPSQGAKMAQLFYSFYIACSVPGTSCRNQDTAPATAPPTDLLTASSPAKYMEDWQRMALTTAGSPSCPQQGRKQRAGSSESKGSPESMGPGRRNWKPKLKQLQGPCKNEHKEERTAPPPARSWPNCTPHSAAGPTLDHRRLASWLKWWKNPAPTRARRQGHRESAA